MVTARERLRQLSLAQEAADDEAESISVQPRFGLPRGGGILVRPVRPSAAEGLDPHANTPFTDFGEMFLNDLGISSPRQRLATTEALAARHSANQTIIQAVEDQAASIVQRGGVVGNDVEVFRDARLRQEHAAKLMDNPNPDIQEAGLAMMQSVASIYDEMNKANSLRLAGVRDQFTTRLNGFLDLGREDASLNDSVFAQVEEYTKRNGASAPLPVTIKESVAGYLGGSSFAQKEGETRGIFENLPGFNVSYDPSETITGGEAATLLSAVAQARRKTIVQNIAGETETARNAGFRILDKDGRLDVNEIPVGELEPEISRLSGMMAADQPFNIRPGLPSAEDARRTAQASMDAAAATAGKFQAGLAQSYDNYRDEFNKNFYRGLEEIEDIARGIFGETPEQKMKRKITVRPTND